MNDDELPDTSESFPHWSHYSGDHQANQHEPGQHIVEPVSHEPLDQTGASLSRDEIIRLVRDLRRKSRSWWQDALWPIYEAELYRHLWILYWEEKREPLNACDWDDLMWIRHYLHLKPLPRR